MSFIGSVGVLSQLLSLVSSFHVVYFLDHDPCISHSVQLNGVVWKFNRQHWNISHCGWSVTISESHVTYVFKVCKFILSGYRHPFWNFSGCFEKSLVFSFSFSFPP